jgi:2-polyprenyl-6-hydroxyphenyl methylase/3-demethylubiquinone-9 3-methyltransferase
MLVFATVNRTTLSYVFAILMAEHVLRLVPEGTHRWDRFVQPQELKRWLEHNTTNIVVHETVGLKFDPFTCGFRPSSTHLDINYLLYCSKKPFPDQGNEPNPQ